MTYIILRANYANSENTSILLKTVEAGDIVVSPLDTPTLWEDALAANPEAYSPVVAIPSFVTMRQARLALLSQGLLDDVDAAIAAMAGVQGEAARIEWQYSQEVHRNKQIVAALAPILGFTEQQLDSLFLLASGL
jgi:hypothetical protein